MVFIPPHELGFRDDVIIHRLIQFLAARASRQVQLDVERV
jgi:hypothetical protein